MRQGPGERRLHGSRRAQVKNKHTSPCLRQTTLHTAGRCKMFLSVCLDRLAELKAGFCIVGLQALAEMNQWPGVLPWLLQQYEQPERMAAKIMQMW